MVYATIGGGWRDGPGMQLEAYEKLGEAYGRDSRNACNDPVDITENV